MNFEQWLKDYLYKQYQGSQWLADQVYNAILQNPQELENYQRMFTEQGQTPPPGDDPPGGGYDGPGSGQDEVYDPQFPKWIENKYRGLDEQFVLSSWRKLTTNPTDANALERAYLMKRMSELGFKDVSGKPLAWESLYQQGKNSSQGGVEQQIQEYLRRIGSGEFNAGQLYEFMGRIGLLRNFQGDNAVASLPSYDPQSSQYQPPTIDPKTFFNPDFINKTFNATAGNINQAGSSMASQARNAAAALGGSRGLVNPSGFTLAAGSRASAPYAAQLGENEANRAKALYGMNQDLFGAYKGQQDFSEDARRFGLNFGQTQTQNLFNRSIQNMGLAEAFREGKTDIWGALLNGLFKAGSAYLGGG